MSGLVERRGFTVAEGRDAGLSRRQLYGPGVQRSFRGVRTIDVDIEDHRVRCRAYAALRRPGHIFSHHSAAALHGFPLRWAVQSRDVHVAVFAPLKPPRMDGVVGHELRGAGHRIVTLDDMQVVAAEDAWAQLSGVLPIDDLVAIGDWLITGDEPYSGTAPSHTRDQLESAIRHHGRRPGVRRLREAFELVRYGPLSPQESRLRLELVRAGLPEPSLNHDVHDRERRIAMVDLAYPDHRLAIEYLGDHHRTDADTYREDIYRRERQAAAGWDVVFLTVDDLAGPTPRAPLIVRRAYARASRRP
ncbi:hypothetical protein KNO15_14145 [Leifsonia shinshuensis]|uniref:hypothetical protein n=1 Tax=Leifsonia shinshuensis TaxID=150026 RepID=UPI001F509CA6|nr:hypothetical protein [Leifsonia shinshuensis]MCI0157836.1 hypothetical protein [Leifsonia shinshuensis]